MWRFAMPWRKKPAGRSSSLIDYTEELTAGNPRHGAVIQVKTGVKKNGILIAQHVQFIFDSGAYGAYRPQGFLVGAHDAPGPYRVPNCLVEEKYVYTNKMPCGYMRAPGHLQAMFACESQTDLVARQLKHRSDRVSPHEFHARRRCLAARGGDPACESHRNLAEAALDESGFRQPKEKKSAAVARSRTGFPKAANLTLLSSSMRNGVVTLSSAVTDTGPGVFTMMRQIVGEELKVPLDSIRVEMLDSVTSHQRHRRARQQQYARAWQLGIGRGTETARRDSQRRRACDGREAG